MVFSFVKNDYPTYFGVTFPVIKLLRWILLGLLIFIAFAAPPLFEILLRWIFIFSPLWAPALLAIIFWKQWVGYVRARWIAKQPKVLLEIRFPERIAKTPRAMEAVFTGMNIGGGESTFISRWWDGKVRAWWSLEILSDEGKIRFFIWTFETQRDLVEAQFYSQYPDIEIFEVEDYMSGFDGGKHDIQETWGMEYTFAKPDAYPLKTYIDYQLDEPTKDSETVVDPITSVFERLSTIGPGEMIALQIVIRQNKGAKYDNIFPFFKWKEWKAEAQEEIDKIYEKAKPKVGDPVTGEITEGYPLLQPQQVNVIKALERSIEKPGYDTGIRSIYIAKKGNFVGTRIPSCLVWVFNSFASGYLNKFVPSGFWHVTLDYPWQDIGGRTTKKYSKAVVDAFRRRSFFHPPYNNIVHVLTTEELATIFHFPSEETKAPGLERINSRRGEPPANLPI